MLQICSKFLTLIIDFVNLATVYKFLKLANVSSELSSNAMKVIIILNLLLQVD